MAARLAKQKATPNLIDNLLPQTILKETPSASIKCLLCHGILKNPLQLSCGHRVCRLCYKIYEEDHKDKRYCPEDGELIDNTFPDMSALTEIMNLTCYCMSRGDGCEWEGLILDLEDHVQNCGFNIKLECPYSDFHCQFIGVKKYLDIHLREDFTQHDSLVATCLSETVNSLKENRKIMDGVKEQSAVLQNNFVETNEKTVALQSMLIETAVLLNKSELKTDRPNEQLKRMEELLKLGESKKATFMSFHSKFKELVKKVEAQMSDVDGSQNKSGTKKEKTAGDSKKSLVDKVKRVQESNKQHETQLSDLGVKIRIFQCSSYDGNYIWKLDNLRNRFTEALSGKVDELYTPPLYTSSFGYKYSAKVMFYGAKDKVVNNNVKHISVYIVLMQGDYDEILKWPFPYPITITLFNTSKKADISQTLYPDPNKVHFQKPYKNMNNAIGFSKFCTHDRLFNDGFVKNDAIYFKIVVDKTGINVKEPNI